MRLPLAKSSDLPVCTGQKFIDSAEKWCSTCWSAWMLAPVLGSLLVVLAVLLINSRQIDIDNYWLMQRDWFLTWNGGFSILPHWAWLNLTQLGDAGLLFPILSPLIIWRPRAWAAMAGSIPLGITLSETGKHLTTIPRPGAVFDSHQFTVLGNSLVGFNSLPSGHSVVIVGGLIAVLATLVSHPRNRTHWLVVAAVLSFAGLVCLSRVAVGAHWPFDIVVGAACGWFAGLTGAALTRSQCRWWQWMQNPSRFWILSNLMFIWSAVLLSRYPTIASESAVLWLAILISLMTAVWLMTRFLRRSTRA